MVVPLFAVAIAAAVVSCLAIVSKIKEWTGSLWISLTLLLVIGGLTAFGYYEVPEDYLALSHDARILAPGHYVILNQEFVRLRSEGRIAFQAAGVMRIEYDFRVAESDRKTFSTHRAEIIYAGSTEQFIVNHIGPALVEYVASRDDKALESFLEVFRSEYGVTLEHGSLGIILQH